jgi:cardiolipin synthase
VYLFLSTRKSKTATVQFEVNSERLPGNQLSSTQKILLHSGSPGAQENQEIELLPTGVAAYEQLMALIRGARRSIHVTTFIFGKDQVGLAVVDALSEKAKEGVDVRVLVDSLGATLIRHPSFKRYQQMGGKIAYFMPIFHLPFRGRTNLRNHRKLMVVDGERALVGGMNLAQEYLGPTADPKRWVDLAVSVKGGCVQDLKEIFLRDWAYAHRAEFKKSREPYRASQGGKLLAQVVASGPDVEGDLLYDVLLSAIHESKKNIWIVSPYFIPDEGLTKALDLAVKRGVSVQIIIPERSNHFLADLARGSFIRDLHSVGVQIAFYPKMIHAKVVMIDQTLAIVGSANFDMRSLLFNYELGLVIYSQPSLKDLEKWIQEQQDETGSEFPPANFWRDLVEGIARIIGPIL